MLWKYEVRGVPPRLEQKELSHLFIYETPFASSNLRVFCSYAPPVVASSQIDNKRSSATRVRGGNILNDGKD